MSRARLILICLAACLWAPLHATPLERSVIGVEGLAHVLKGAKIPLRRSNPLVTRSSDALSLRILPLYDDDLSSTALGAVTHPEDTTIRDIEKSDLETKLRALPTLLILPKWRRRVKDSGILHQSELIPEQSLVQLFSEIFDARPGWARKEPVFTDIPWRGETLSLFHAQGIPPEGLPKLCRPRLSDAQMVYIATCRYGAGEEPIDVHVITDPDLINTHGLSLSHNAPHAVALIRALLDEDTRPVYLDTSSDILLDVSPVGYEKKSLAPFFAYPLSVLWGGFAAILAALAWRGLRRFGAARPRQSGAHELSQSAAIHATARLLRLSGHDGPPVADFVQTQLDDLTTQIFGQQSSGTGQQARLFAHIARRDPALSEAFKASAEGLIRNAPTLPRAELYRDLRHYSTLLKKVADSHGTLRISGHRRHAAP